MIDEPKDATPATNSQADSPGPSIPDSSPDITRLLNSWCEGDSSALEELTPFILEDLRCLALHYFRNERPGHTLQPTALVHETYLRLVGARLGKVENRQQFFAIAARLIRQILVDHARRSLTQKRGRRSHRLTLGAAANIQGPAPMEPALVLSVHEALARLEESMPRQSRVVVLKFFGGLTLPEVASALEISQATVERDWHFARHWLAREIGTLSDESTSLPAGRA